MSSSSTSLSSSNARNSSAAVAASLPSISNGWISFTVKIDSWLLKISLPALQGSFSSKQWIRSSSDPSVFRFNAHDLKNVFIVSGLTFSHASRIQFTIGNKLVDSFVSQPLVVHFRCISLEWLVPANIWRLHIFLAPTRNNLNFNLFSMDWGFHTVFNMALVRVPDKITTTKWKSSKNFIHPSVCYSVFIHAFGDEAM